MWNKAVWLGVPESEIKRGNILQGDMNGRFAYFRCELELAEEAGSKIVITANSRYRLWINEQPVLSGPCKGDRYRHFYEEVDISDKLKIGKNVFAVQVLLCDLNSVTSIWDERAPIFAVASLPNGHRLAVEGDIVNKSGEVLGCLTTGEAPWKVYLEDSFYLKSMDFNPLLGAVLLGAIQEEIDTRKAIMDWKKIDFDATDWAEPKDMGGAKQTFVNHRVGFLEDFPLKKREIPLLFEREREFADIIKEGQSEENDFWVVRPGEKIKFILDAGVHTNAQMKYRFEKGSGATVRIVYGEKYFSENGEEIARTDREHGILVGWTDKLTLNGQEHVYEPFWYRTFRFIEMEIQAKEEEVVVSCPKMLVTGYPLEMKSEIKADEPWVEKLWDMSARTLQNCMMDTYMDCPYYEQIQYAMDTRLEMLFHYAADDDYRLAKRAIEDFHHAITPMGVLQGRSVSCFGQTIITFGFHYIMMMEEYYRQTMDMETLIRFRSDVDVLLDYFAQRIGEKGLIEVSETWMFVDWVPNWEDTAGVPQAVGVGPSTIHNLMYAYALKSGAYIYRVTGRNALAEEYEERRQEILKNIQKYCWDEEAGLYREGPAFKQYTQHAQAWAVLNGMVSQEEAKAILKRTLENSEVLQCTFSTSYELFRAFEWAGNYEDTRYMLEKWIRLTEKGCTTCPETPVNARSECHAWSSLPMYEMLRTIAGIKMGADGWESIIIEPHLDYVNHLEGKAVTPKGIVEFIFDKKSGRYDVKLPDGVPGTVIVNGEILYKIAN